MASMSCRYKVSPWGIVAHPAGHAVAVSRHSNNTCGTSHLSQHAFSLHFRFLRPGPYDRGGVGAASEVHAGLGNGAWLVGMLQFGLRSEQENHRINNTSHAVHHHWTTDTAKQ
ncbi:hypothetical protein PoB_003713200 [Plakobranchus ocellatus]|uniref:Uncharacterized protein n=1 Tax=Plakobranchus ocellatus TaxID=259542 RepID=A0AAV4ATI8_9GAST|nr:hypothetical protein PoB_003713200 [Plakobranchus ocellatus]